MSPMLPGFDFVLHLYDLGATFAWAISGAMLAARKGYDLMGIATVALVSGCGGGLLRDAIFLHGGPPLLVRTPNYLTVVAVAAVAVVIFGGYLRRQRWFDTAMTLTDALGIGAYAVVGMGLATQAHLPRLAIILIGLFNAIGGGILRDLLLGMQPEVLKPSVLLGFATLFGCVLYILLADIGVSLQWASGCTVALVFLVRLLALRFGWRSTALKAFAEDWGREGAAGDKKQDAE